MSTLGRTLSNVSWTAGGHVLTTALQFGVSIALARLLAPHDFGVMAVAVGLQVVLEDYVHAEWLKVAALIVLRFAVALLGLAAALAVLRIALGAP